MMRWRNQNTRSWQDDDTHTDAVDAVFWSDESLATDNCNASLPSFESVRTSLTILVNTNTYTGFVVDVFSRMATSIIGWFVGWYLTALSYNAKLKFVKNIYFR